MESVKEEERETGVVVQLSPAGEQQVTVTARDRPGLLADLSEHIRACGVDVVSASVATDVESGLVIDSFVVRALALLPPRPAPLLRLR